MNRDQGIHITKMPTSLGYGEIAHLRPYDADLLDRPMQILSAQGALTAVAIEFNPETGLHFVQYHQAGKAYAESWMDVRLLAFKFEDESPLDLQTASYAQALKQGLVGHELCGHDLLLYKPCSMRYELASVVTYKDRLGLHLVQFAHGGCLEVDLRTQSVIYEFDLEDGVLEVPLPGFGEPSQLSQLTDIRLDAPASLFVGYMLRLDLR